MPRFYAQLNDGGTINRPADSMEIADNAIYVYFGEKLVAYLDLSAVLYAHICT